MAALEAKLCGHEKQSCYNPRWELSDERYRRVYAHILRWEQHKSEDTINANQTMIASFTADQRHGSGNDAQSKAQRVRSLQRSIDYQYTKWYVVRPVLSEGVSVVG